MILSNPSVEIYNDDFIAQLKKIENYGRVCYKSEDKITFASYTGFIRQIIKRGHESVLEHGGMSCRFVCDRGVSHELVRHRIGSFSQESTRYCNYKGGIEYIIPSWCPDIVAGEYYTQDQEALAMLANAIGKSEFSTNWIYLMGQVERLYIHFIKNGSSPQEARSILPNSLKTEVCSTFNFRQWRNIFRLRTEKAAHPQMRQVMIPLLIEAKKRIPAMFDDIPTPTDV